MPTPRWKQIIRQFPENGLKLLLEQPDNVRELLTLTQSELLPLIDFEQLKLVRTTFVARDFRHFEADVVLTAPLRERGGKKGRTVIWLYILLEHQSEPDALMPLRLLDYFVQIVRAQLRAWTSTHHTFTGFRIQPVLPVILYTETRRWDTPGDLIDLVDLGERFRSFVPSFEPLFVNLQALDTEQLVSRGGAFGHVLSLVRQRKAKPQEFRGLLEAAMASLEALPPAQRLRWLELLSYIHALVYHNVTEKERRNMQEVIEASVQTDTHRQEVQTMQRTAAQEWQAKGLRQGLKKGRQEGRQEGAVLTLRATRLRLLRRRFGVVPEGVAATVNASDDVEQLQAWMERVLFASSLADVGISG